MCGIFGFVGRDHARPDFDFLRAIACNTEARGKHAFGFAWSENGRLRMFKKSGRISGSLGVLAMAQNAELLIGHCRYATRGDARNNLNNHPHPADGGWVVHNGTVHDYLIIQHQRNLLMSSQCDSEIIGLTIEDAEGTLIERCAEAAEETVSDLAFAGIWTRPGRVVILKRGKPLFQRETPEGLYFSSCNSALGGKEMPESTVEEWTSKGLTRALDVGTYQFKKESVWEW